MKEFWGKATPDGTTIDALMKRASDKSSQTGRVWIVIDNNVTEVMSRADETNGTQRIYAYIISQQDVLDFAYDEWGTLLWILYRIPYRDDTDPVNSSGSILPRYMLWTQEEWVLLEERAKGRANYGTDQAVRKAQTIYVNTSTQNASKREIVPIARGDNKLGPVIPVRAINHMETDEPYSPPGLVDDIAYLDRTVANYLSNLGRHHSGPDVFTVGHSGAGAFAG